MHLFSSLRVMHAVVMQCKCHHLQEALAPRERKHISRQALECSMSSMHLVSSLRVMHGVVMQCKSHHPQEDLAPRKQKRISRQALECRLSSMHHTSVKARAGRHWNAG